MKLICLNIWGGKIYEPLMKYVREQSAEADIFCFQEVFRSPRKDIEISRGTRVHILDELAAALPDFNCVFHPAIRGVDEVGPVDFDVEIGQAEFIKNPIKIVSSGDVPIFATKELLSPKNEPFYPENFGYVKIPLGSEIVTILNIHGLTFRPDKKLDGPERLIQSRAIKEFAVNEKGPVVICGDLNLMPQTESLKIFNDPFVDLVKKYGIENTRSKLSPWHGTPNELKFSDYVFVSPEMKISGFSAPDVEISDHLPLVLEFS